MSSTPVANVGDKAANGAVVTKSYPPKTNDAHNVATDPNEGRLLMTAPDGYQYTTIASSTVQPTGTTSYTLLKDAE